MIAIPNMKKPKNCIECKFTSPPEGECWFVHSPKDCPLIEIDDEAIDIAQDIIDGCKELKERVDKGIVRCGECKWSYIDEKYGGTMWCRVHFHDYRVNSDGFCNYGERRTGELNTERD